MAAVLQGSSFVLDKTILSIRRIGYREYTSVSFPIIFLIGLIIFFIFRPPLAHELFSNSLLILLLAGIVLSLGNNILFYRALDKDRLGELQIFDLLSNIPVILVSGLIFTDERNLFIIVPALVASFAIVWSHWEHHHLSLAKKTTPYVIWIMISMPIGAAISKQLLTLWNPIALELFRNGGMAIVLGLLFANSVKNIPPRGWALLLATNSLSAIAMILFYFSYKFSGVVYTVLIFSLQPILVYLSSLLFLKEPFQRKKAIAFAIVLVSIITAQIIG